MSNKIMTREITQKGGSLQAMRQGRGLLCTMRCVFMIVMMMGVCEMWGQITPGFYYLASNAAKADGAAYTYSSSDPANSFYLCPAIGSYHDNNVDHPYMTTFKTNKDQNSLWKIEAVSDVANCYYLIHYKTGKYLASNATSSTNYDGGTNRRVVHLENKADDSDIYKFYIIDKSGFYQIYPKDYRPGGTLTDASGKSLNVKADNWSMYVPQNGQATGIIGVYDYETSNKANPGSQWKIEPLTSTQPCATPIVKYSGDEINISYPYTSETGITIYYTTDGTDPSTSLSSNASTSFNISANGVVKVRAFATKSGFVNSDEAVLWGSARPFLIQSKENFDYYLVPSGDKSKVNTSSMPGTSMQWTLQSAGASTDGVPYYYLVNNYNEGKKIQSAPTFAMNDASTDDNKFCIIENGYNTGDFFLIPISDLSKSAFKTLKKDNKKNYTDGNTGNEYNITLETLKEYKDSKGLELWRFKVCNESADQKNLFSSSPFYVSDDNETHYYHIASKGTPSGYYIVPPADANGYATTSNTSSVYTDNPWIFKVAASDDWQTYYYIINAASGKYMYFNKANNSTSNLIEVISMKDFSEKNAENEERFQFIMVRSTTTGACYIVPKGYSYADNYHRNFYENQYFGLWFHAENNVILKTTWSRSSTANNVKWSFEEATITDLYLDPVISQDENGYVSITHPTAACDYYYTTDSSTPSIPANAEIAPTDPTNKYTASFLPEVGVTQITAKAVSKDVYTVSSNIVTYDLSEYTQPTITYDYENNTITISTNEGARIYYNYGSDPSNPTIDPNVTTQTFTTDAITGTTVVKALAVKEGWAPSEIITMTVYKPTIELSASTATYDNTDHTPAITVKDGENIFDAGKYTVSYQKNGETVTECKDAGTYTLIVSDVEGDNEIVGGATTFTINPASLTITANAQTKGYGDPDPEFTYSSLGLIEGDKLTGTLSREEGEDVRETPYSITQGTLTAGSNYTITYTGANLTITKKSIGTGSTPAAGITVDIVDNDGNYTATVKHGGRVLTEGAENDYTVTVSHVSGTAYLNIALTGSNHNYTGSFTGKYALVDFGTHDEANYSGTFVSNDEGDDDYATPAGMAAYIVTGVDDQTVTAMPVDYIPKNVPVLLLTDADATGFFVNAKGEEPTADTSSNMLAVVSDNPSKHFDTGKIYLLYKDEFVLNMEGNLAKGKVYLPKPSGSPAPARLRIVTGQSTGIENYRLLDPNPQLSGFWYTLDGRRLSGKPTKKGLYLQNGKKMVVR